MSVPEKISLSGLPRGELEALAERLLAENAALGQALAELRAQAAMPQGVTGRREGRGQARAELRAEVAMLKGVKGRPEVRPSGMEKGTGPGPEARGQGRGAGSRKAKRLTIHEERVIAAGGPAGWGRKGREDFLAQEIGGAGQPGR